MPQAIEMLFIGVVDVSCKNWIISPLIFVNLIHFLLNRTKSINKIKKLKKQGNQTPKLLRLCF